ncbi:MAG: hypothetical protein IJB81_04460 [Clostridia bacterium]|nr:hypothetical protein [Clostridia bacterium]
MFELIGNLIGLVFDLVGMAFSLAFGAVEFVFGILGGIFSLVLSLGGFVLIAALIAVAVKRRRKYRACRQQPEEAAPAAEAQEEFTSFYDQFRTQE